MRGRVRSQALGWLELAPLLPERLVLGLSRLVAAMMYAFGDSARPNEQVVCALVVDSVRWVRVILAGLSPIMREKASTRALARGSKAAGHAASNRMVQCYHHLRLNGKQSAAPSTTGAKKSRTESLCRQSAGRQQPMQHGSEQAAAAGKAVGNSSKPKSEGTHSDTHSLKALEIVPVWTGLTLEDVKQLMPRHAHYYARWQRMSKKAGAGRAYEGDA